MQAYSMRFLIVPDSLNWRIVFSLFQAGMECRPTRRSSRGGAALSVSKPNIKPSAIVFGSISRTKGA